MEKGATAIEANYFTHDRRLGPRDSFPGNRDNCFGLNFSHMLKERTFVFISMDIKKERDQFHDSTALNDPFYNASHLYNTWDAGFDSSIVSGKRYSVGAGIEFFSDANEKIVRSFAVSAGLHQLKMNESGLLLQSPYHRFYNMDQISLSLQQNFLFKISNSFRLAWVTRLTILNNFKATTDYSSDEKLNAGLRDKRLNAFFGLTGLYADYQPLKNIPLHINGQFFNEGWVGKHPMAKYELGEVHVKGTGLSIGMKYVLNEGRRFH